MKKALLLAISSAVLLLSGCATVPLESAEKAELAKQFNPPSPDKAGIYVYRSDVLLGAALIKDLHINDECIGQSAKGIFFYHEVDGNGRHKITTQSEFSPNELFLDTTGGNLYFVRQYIVPGYLIHGADLESVGPAVAKDVIKDLDMAKKGTCSK